MKSKGLLAADILLPKNCDLNKWSVIACDQFTATGNYWERVEETVGDARSALRLILPEAALGADDVQESIDRINATMEQYVADGVFTEYKNSVFYMERALWGQGIRAGVICKIDLENFGYLGGDQVLIRSTEKTVTERIPPRIKIRESALLELPHIMLFMNDGEEKLIEKIGKEKSKMEKLYGFELMEGGGHIDGWRLQDAMTEAFLERVGALENSTAMLFAVGDGNHSLAAAKALYERQKAELGERAQDLPSRYALVEIVSLRDDAIQFEPIHRALFGVETEKVIAELSKYGNNNCCNKNGIKWKTAKGAGEICFGEDALPISALQDFLDGYVAQNGGQIDYIHGCATLAELCREPDVITFELPPFDKDTLFPSVMRNGSLPRKTFSVGRAQDKRYYLESRKIR